MIALAAALSLGLSPAFALADTGSTTATGNATAAFSTRAKSHADQEIERRTANLNDLISHVQGIKNLSDADKASIANAVTNQVNALAALKTKIDADTDLATLKTDVKSITDSYRIYALVLPQIRIITAADRIVTIVKEMQQLSSKFQTRIAAAQSAGADVAAATAALTDFNAKVADAGVQAQAAVTEIVSLVPDNGDKTVRSKNTTALKDARTKIVAAQKDLAAARHDAAIIVSTLKGKVLKPNTAGTSSSEGTSSSGTGQ